jgi:hypothetical protein
MERLNTPWGVADQVDRIGDKGILHVSTPSHGGLFVPAELLERMPAALRGSNSYSGCGNWFEEDVEWAIPVLAFPDEFPPATCQAAISTVASYRDAAPGKYFSSVVAWFNTSAALPVKLRGELS